MPPVDGRSKSGYVGLKNGGATCYMNSVLQQLFMTPGVKDAILATEEEDADEDRYVNYIPTTYSFNNEILLSIENHTLLPLYTHRKKSQSMRKCMLTHFYSLLTFNWRDKSAC